MHALRGGGGSGGDDVDGGGWMRGRSRENSVPGDGSSALDGRRVQSGYRRNGRGRLIEQSGGVARLERKWRGI